jgi:uncharacterized protein (DUF305 family)
MLRKSAKRYSSHVVYCQVSALTCGSDSRLPCAVHVQVIAEMQQKVTDTLVRTKDDAVEVVRQRLEDEKREAMRAFETRVTEQKEREIAEVSPKRRLVSQSPLNPCVVRRSGIRRRWTKLGQ